MSDFRPGLEGVIAFETEIAEPDKEGSALRYRGVDIEELVGAVSFEQVWGLLVDDSFEPGMPSAGWFGIDQQTAKQMADHQGATAHPLGLLLTHRPAALPGGGQRADHRAGVAVVQAEQVHHLVGGGTDRFAPHPAAERPHELSYDHHHHHDDEPPYGTTSDEPRIGLTAPGSP